MSIIPAQFNVSRLLKLKALRADVQQRLLVLLRDRISAQAKAYINPARRQLIEEALEEQITILIQEAGKEASIRTNAKRHNTKSLFSRRLCRLLKDIRTEK
ncbi:MAG: hypothetical protein ABI417_05405 [Coleofasciculaceae cyanobacterium]